MRRESSADTEGDDRFRHPCSSALPETAYRLKVGFFALFGTVGLALALFGVAHGGSTHAIEADIVQVVLTQGKPMIVEFGSTRCKACRDMKLVLDELQRTHSDRVAIADVDLFSTSGRGMISRYRIQMMPTQVFYDAHGKEIGRHLGPLSALEILNRLGVNAGSQSGASSQ